MIDFFVVILIGYMIGSIPSGVILARFFTVTDPRSFGSGSIGATNMLRSGHKGAALMTLICDAAKGAIAIMFVQSYINPVIAGWAGIAAMLGHCFPVWLGFKGGKGVATGLGVLIALSPLLALCAVICWLGIVWLSRISSLGALGANFLVATWVVSNPATENIRYPLLMMVAVVLIQHRRNIQNLWQKKEPKITFGKK